MLKKIYPQSAGTQSPLKWKLSQATESLPSPYHKSSGKYQKIAVYHGRRINSVERQAYKD